jgi:DNA-binding CsgD family transcriptional regulator
MLSARRRATVGPVDTDARKRLADGLESLTPKEREVLGLIAQGQTNAEIAETLHITFPTAKTHVSAILSKLGVESRDEAARLAGTHRPRPRSKLRAFGLGSLALKLAGAATLVACAGLGVTAFALTRDTVPSNTLTVSLSDLQPGQPRLYKPAILGATPSGDPYGVWVVLQKDGTVDAFFDRDPWSYCIANWYPDEPTEGYIVGADGTRTPATASFNGVERPLEIGSFRVGCSGWKFNIHGDFRFGATPRGLDSFPVTVDGDSALIRFNEVQLGKCAFTNLYPSDCSQPGGPELRATVPPPIMPTYGFPKP